MDGQDYLNQISATNRPVKGGRMSNFLSSKLALFFGIALIVLVITIIAGLILSSNKVDIKSLTSNLTIHINNTTSVIKSYQNNVRSSELRASSASLQGVFDNTSRGLTDYLEKKYQLKLNAVDKKIVEQANLAKDNLSNELFQAKINGALDRVFAHKMAYEIALITTDERKILNLTSDDELKGILTTSYESLLNLYDKFNDFSETK